MADNKKLTTDHEEIRQWVEEHDGCPVAVREPSGGNDRPVRIFFQTNI